MISAANDAAVTSRRRSRALYAAVLIPAAGATVVVALFAILDAAGHTPVSYPVPVNIAEAAAMGSGATVLRMLREGADPNEILPVTPGVVSTSITRVTAVEAAVWGRRVELLRLLEREGALEPVRREYIACLAKMARVPAVLEYFGPATGCDEARVRRTLQARGE